MVQSGILVKLNKTRLENTVKSLIICKLYQRGNDNLRDLPNVSFESLILSLSDESTI